MSYTIPEPYCWDESFATFYKQIDEEHKGLFNGIFDVAKTPSDAATLASLVTKVTTHFTNEEGIMKGKGYSDLANHQKLHAEFLTKCGSVNAPVDADTIDFLKKWLVNHIKTTDFKYKGKLD